MIVFFFNFFFIFIFFFFFIIFLFFIFFFFFSSRRRHTRSYGDWSSDVCSSDLERALDERRDVGAFFRDNRQRFGGKARLFQGVETALGPCDILEHADRESSGINLDHRHGNVSRWMWPSSARARAARGRRTVWRSAARASSSSIRRIRARRRAAAASRAARSRSSRRHSAAASCRQRSFAPCDWWTPYGGREPVRYWGREPVHSRLPPARPTCSSPAAPPSTARSSPPRETPAPRFCRR